MKTGKTFRPRGLIRANPEGYARFLAELLLARDGQWLRICEIAERAGLSRPTAYRMASDIERIGILRLERRDPGKGGGIRSAYKLAKRENHEEMSV